MAVLKGDRDQIDRVVALAKGKRGAEHRVAHAEAVALARSGRLQAARLSSNRAMGLAVQDRVPELSAIDQSARAVWEGFREHDAEAKSGATAALRMSNGREVEYAAGLALALSGDFSRSEMIAAGLEKRHSEDTFVRLTDVPVLRAVAGLRRGNPADALERLQTARQYELAVNGLNANGGRYLGGLHSAYVRGEAFMAVHRYVEASAEFQKILDHRGIVALDPIGALAYLHLGRVSVLLGDNAKAKASYEAFLTLWKDADTDIQILKNARAEYNRM